MGPQPSSRGNSNRTVSASVLSLSLQWGRNLPVAEIRSSPDISATSPTMLQWGPQPSSRGNVMGLIMVHLSLTASMGPQPSQSRKSVALSVGPGGQPELQWGRNLPVAEIRRAVGRTGRATLSFNGAATFQSRKMRPALAPIDSRSMGLQWGRNLPVAEISPARDL